MAPEETAEKPAPEGGSKPAEPEKAGPGEAKVGSKMTPEEKAAAIAAAKEKAAAAKAAKEAAAAAGAAGGAPGAAKPGEGQPAQVGGAPAGAAAPAGGAGTGASAAKPAAKAEKVEKEPEIRPGRQIAGGLALKKGEKVSKEEVIAKALEKIRETEKALEARKVSPEVTRRALFKKIGWAGFNAFMLFLGGCFARFFFPRVLFEPPARFKAGYPQEYTVGEVSTKYKDTNRVWIVREATGFYAIFARCTHLGCTPMWLEGEQKFKCPCHGSGFTKEAINYEGPAPRPMERCFITIADDGQILIDTGIRFRYEEGKWDDPRAYLRYA
jgi:cytochrome b6-f complex iron-sulfur subunit